MLAIKRRMVIRKETQDYDQMRKTFHAGMGGQGNQSQMIRMPHLERSCQG